VLVVSVVLAVGLASLVFMAILLIALVRQLKLLGSSLRRFQEDVQPLLEEIQESSATAQDRMQRLRR
jgi:hypothetical protein